MPTLDPYGYQNKGSDYRNRSATGSRGKPNSGYNKFQERRKSKTVRGRLSSIENRLGAFVANKSKQFGRKIKRHVLHLANHPAEAVAATTVVLSTAYRLRGHMSENGLRGILDFLDSYAGTVMRPYFKSIMGYMKDARTVQNAVSEYFDEVEMRSWESVENEITFLADEFGEAASTATRALTQFGQEAEELAQINLERDEVIHHIMTTWGRTTREGADFFTRELEQFYDSPYIGDAYESFIQRTAQVAEFLETEAGEIVVAGEEAAAAAGTAAETAAPFLALAA